MINFLLSVGTCKTFLDFFVLMSVVFFLAFFFFLAQLVRFVSSTWRHFVLVLCQMVYQFGQVCIGQVMIQQQQSIQQQYVCPSQGIFGVLDSSFEVIKLACKWGETLVYHMNTDDTYSKCQTSLLTFLAPKQLLAQVLCQENVTSFDLPALL